MLMNRRPTGISKRQRYPAKIPKINKQEVVEMSEAVKLVIIALKTIAVSTAVTVILLLSLGAGTVNLYFTFLSLGLLSLAISAFLQS